MRHVGEGDRRLGISASTASRWLRCIEPTAEQVAALDARNPAINGQMAGARSLAWAEGSNPRNKVTFTNSDADMVSFFLRFLRRCDEVDDGQMTLSVNVHLGNGLTLDQIESWWLARLGLPVSCLRAAA
jgi:hypothetical protein